MSVREKFVPMEVNSNSGAVLLYFFELIFPVHLLFGFELDLFEFGLPRKILNCFLKNGATRCNL